MSDEGLEYNDDYNCVDVGKGVKVEGYIKGVNNKVNIEGSPKGKSKLTIKIFGNGNSIDIKSPLSISGLTIQIGNKSTSVNGVICLIGENFSIGPRGVFKLFNNFGKLIIGENCMFSTDVYIRSGELPHLIFDMRCGDYLDISDGVFISDNVWVGEDVYLGKKVTIPTGCVVGARSVVTKRFENENCVIAGNPANVVKENVKWFRNKGYLEKDSTYDVAFRKFLNELHG